MEKTMTEAQAISLTRLHKLILKQIDDTAQLLFLDIKDRSMLTDDFVKKLDLIPLGYIGILVAFGQINDIDQALLRGHLESILQNAEDNIKQRITEVPKND